MILLSPVLLVPLCSVVYPTQVVKCFKKLYYRHKLSRGHHRGFSTKSGERDTMLRTGAQTTVTTPLNNNLSVQETKTWRTKLILEIVLAKAIEKYRNAQYAVSWNFRRGWLTQRLDIIVKLFKEAVRWLAVLRRSKMSANVFRYFFLCLFL